MRGKVRICNI